MSEKFRTYRVSSSRDQSWDYTNDGSYYITLCTRDRISHFGEVMHWKDIQCQKDWEARVISSDLQETHAVLLSPEGLVVRDIWNEISSRFPWVSCDELMIMPNHIHGIIDISKRLLLIKSKFEGSPSNSDTDMANGCIYEKNVSPLGHIGGVTGQQNPMLVDGLSRVVRWFKGKSAFYIRKRIPQFNWQSRFHDHIIRSEYGYQRVLRYMKENPVRWSENDNAHSKENDWGLSL